MKRMASARRTSRSSATLTRRRLNGRGSGYVVCVKNHGYPISLQLMKVYRRLPDEVAARHGQWRIIDEDGEDYLYPARYFVPLALSPAVARTLSTLAD